MRLNILTGDIRVPTALETMGAIIGFGGGALMSLEASASSSTRDRVTVSGDALAFLGAVAFVVYLYTGQVLRKWMGTFMYAFPVNAVGSVLLVVPSVIFEGASTSPSDPKRHVFGWLLDWRLFLIVSGLALVPGLLVGIEISQVNNAPLSL